MGETRVRHAPFYWRAVSEFVPRSCEIGDTPSTGCGGHVDAEKNKRSYRNRVIIYDV